MDKQPVRLVILDVDGTLVRTRTGNQNRSAGPNFSAEQDWEWIPGRLEALLAFRAENADVRFALATNQGGVGHGYHDEDRMREEIALVARALGDDVMVNIAWGMTDAVIERYRHEDPLRKPAPGMLLAAMSHFGIEAPDTVMIGDRPADMAAARAAGCRFIWDTIFFRDLQAPGPRELG